MILTQLGLKLVLLYLHKSRKSAAELYAMPFKEMHCFAHSALTKARWQAIKNGGKGDWSKKLTFVLEAKFNDHLIAEKMFLSASL